MKAMTYLVKQNLIALIRNIRKKPAQLVLYIFLLAMIIMMVFANRNVSEYQQWIPVEFLPASFAAITLLIASFTINQGIKKGSSSYRKADVQFVFPSPISPKLILIYGFLKQLMLSIAVTLWFMFQSINVRNLFGLTQSGFYILLLAVFIIVLYMPITSMWIYAATLRIKTAKRTLTRIFAAMGVALIAAFVGLTLYSSDPAWAVNTLLGHSFFEYIPIVGWITALLNAAKWGFTSWTWMALCLLAAGLVLIVWRLLSSEIPFYEEVLKQTESRESLIKAKRSGTNSIQPTFGKTRNVTIQYNGTGPKAIFYRHLLEYKKSGYLFIDMVTLIMMAIGIAGGFFLRNKGWGPEFSLYAAIYMNFIFSFSGKWAMELQRSFIYMMPGTGFAKLWYATAANHIKHLLDGVAVFVPVSLIIGLSPWVCIAYILAYTAVGSLYIYADVLARRLFGSAYNGHLAGLLKMLCISLILAPALVAFIIIMGEFAHIAMISLLAPLGIVVYSALVSFIIMLLGKNIFKNIELL